MSVLSNFESKVEGAVDGAAAAMFSSPIEPAQIAKKAEKQMKREKLVGSGRQYAPTLYNVLVNERDDKRLFGFYPTMATEIENYLYAKGTDAGMEFDTRPLVRFIPDPGLKKGRFDVIAEVVSAPIIKKLRAEELEYYGIAPETPDAGQARDGGAALQGNHGQKQARDRMPAQAAGGKFAGLDVSADLDGVASAAALPPLSQGSPLQTPRASAMPQAQHSSQTPERVPRPQEAQRVGVLPTPDAGFDEPGVIGNATLFNTSEQRQIPLRKRKLTAGRSKENDIVLADANASRVHIRLSQDATGTWKLTDLGSTNGSLLNGRPVNSAILRSGDEITVGTTVLQFLE